MPAETISSWGKKTNKNFNQISKTYFVAGKGKTLKARSAQVSGRAGPMCPALTLEARLHGYKERVCSHRPVAFPHGDLDAAAARPRTGAEGTPDSPRPVHGGGVVLFGDAQAVFAVLHQREEEERKGEWNVTGTGNSLILLGL